MGTASGWGPPVKPEWLKVTERWQELLVVSEPTPWVSHWDPTANRSRKCAGPECYLCSLGCQKQLRVVVIAIDNRNRDKIVELRERHREMLEGFGSLVGLRIRVRKSGTARNSPVDVEGLEHAAAIERDISRLVDSLGLPAINVADIERPIADPMADPTDADIDHMPASPAVVVSEPVPLRVAEPAPVAATNGKSRFGKHLEVASVQ